MKTNKCELYWRKRAQSEQKKHLRTHITLHVNAMHQINSI